MWSEEIYKGIEIFGYYEDKPFPFEGNIIYSSSVTRFSRGSVSEAEEDIDKYLKNS